MYTTENLINDFESFNLYVNSLETMEESLFFAPIAKNKWSTAEIISHISYWDTYIREETLPQMKKDAVIESVEFDTLNKPAAQFALSGVTQQQLLNKQIETRALLVADLKKKSEEEFFAGFILNGEKTDKYSGYPHTIFNYIAGFLWHDNHHIQQMDTFFKKEQN